MSTQEKQWPRSIDAERSEPNASVEKQKMIPKPVPHEAPISAYVVTRDELERCHPDLVNEISIIVDHDAFIKEMRARLLMLETLSIEEQKRVFDDLEKLLNKALRYIKVEMPDLKLSQPVFSFWERLLLFFDKKRQRQLKEEDEYRKLTEQLNSIENLLAEYVTNLRKDEAMEVIKKNKDLFKTYKDKKKEIDEWDAKLESEPVKDLRKSLIEKAHLFGQIEMNINDQYIYAGYLDRIISVLSTIDVTISTDHLHPLTLSDFNRKSSVLSWIVEQIDQKIREQNKRKDDLERWVLEHHPDT